MNIKNQIEDKILRKIPKEYKINHPLYNFGRNISNKFRYIRKEYRRKEALKFYSHDERYKEYDEKVKKFHDIHKGDRCFIFGCGPSLNKTNIDLLENEIIIGVNTTYKLLDKYKISYEYFATGDGKVWRDNYRNILSLDTILFLGGSTRDSAGVDYLYNKEKYKKIQNCEVLPIKANQIIAEDLIWKNKDLSKGFPGGHGVVQFALPIAHYMGFKEVYLLGVDCDYTGQQHFYSKDKGPPPYYANVNNPKLWEMVFKEYEAIKRGFEEDGRKVYNSTVGGKLEVFERKKLEEII